MSDRHSAHQLSGRRTVGTFMCMYMCSSVCIHTHTRMYTYTHTHRHACACHIHTCWMQRLHEDAMARRLRARGAVARASCAMCITVCICCNTCSVCIRLSMVCCSICICTLNRAPGTAVQVWCAGHVACEPGQGLQMWGVLSRVFSCARVHGSHAGPFS